MAKTPSSMLPLGTLAPSFSLVDVIGGKTVNLDKAAGEIGTVIMFICNHCPYVKHIKKELIELTNDYQKKGFSFIAINSNDAAQYPDDSPENMKNIALEEQYPFPYLFDATQEVALAYQAACTPDFFVFDKDLMLVYRGQLDDSRPGNHLEVTGDSIRTALDCLMSHQPITEEQKPSLGCSIKWSV